LWEILFGSLRKNSTCGSYDGKINNFFQRSLKKNLGKFISLFDMVKDKKVTFVFCLPKNLSNNNAKSKNKFFYQWMSHWYYSSLISMLKD